MKTVILILIFSTFISFGSCNKRLGDWRQEYIDQEKSRIITVQKTYEYNSGDYTLKYIDSTFKTFNDAGQIIGINNQHFYNYDSTGKLIAEKYCMRTCENPGKQVYCYDSLNRLIKTVVVISKDKEWVSAQYYYNDKNLITKKVMGNDSTPTTETYSYDDLSRVESQVRHEFNTNLNKWLTLVDSMHFDINNNMIIKKRHQIGEDLLKISKYIYQDTLLITQIDTAITALPGYLPTSETIHHAYFFRTDYKYDSDNRII